MTQPSVNIHSETSNFLKLLIRFESKYAKANFRQEVTKVVMEINVDEVRTFMNGNIKNGKRIVYEVLSKKLNGTNLRKDNVYGNKKVKVHR